MSAQPPKSCIRNFKLGKSRCGWVPGQSFPCPAGLVTFCGVLLWFRTVILVFPLFPLNFFSWTEALILSPEISLETAVL